MNCRGEERRVRIVNEYSVKPIAYLRLLKGQQKRSDAEANLTDKYYIFECVHKLDPNIKDTIICGNGAGEHFLQLINIKSPPLFDPLKSHGMGSKGKGGNTEGSQIEKWNEVAKQLYFAIQWVIICWNIIPKGPIIDIKDKIEKFRENEPYLSEIKSVNTMISKDYRKRSLTEMIGEFRKENDLKDYDFKLLSQKLEEKGIKSHF